MNGIWIITPASLFHVWAMKFKASLIFFKLSILTLNNVIWVGLFAILLDEAEHVVKASMTSYVPVFYEVINLFIKLQNFLFFFFDGLLVLFLHFVCELLPNLWEYHIAAVSSEVFCLWLLT